ncbi:MAG: hypothetical protein PVH41_19585 [Anaerolineae bacterium]|jgi:hypothetical protein
MVKARCAALAVLRRRCPTKQESISLFAACAFPVHSWAVLWFLHRLPSWILFLKPWDLVGIFAYVQAFALFESAVLFLIVVALSLVLPGMAPDHSLVSRGCVIVLVHAFWILVLHGVGGDIPSWGRFRVLFLLGLYLVSFGSSLALVYRSSHVAEYLEMLAERLVVMLYVYVPLGATGLVLVVLPDILGMG